MAHKTHLKSRVARAFDSRVFPRRLTHGRGLLTIGYCLTTIGYCFPILFYKFLCGDKALMEEDKVMMGGSPSPPTRENPGL